MQMPCAPPYIDHSVPKESREEQDDWSRNEHQQRQPPIHPEQHDANADKKKNVRKENLHTLNEHAFERLRISRHARDQSAGRTFVEKFERETLQVPENVVAKFMRKLLPKQRGHSSAPHSERLSEKLNSAK